MGSIPQSPKIRPGSRDTGFPEPFCGNRNTTLPHPEANLSPDACISADDISVSRVMHRSRRSFLSKHNKRTTSHGVITREMEAMYSDALSADGGDSSHDAASVLVIYPHDGGIARHQQDGAESVGRSSASTHGDGDDHRTAEPSSPGGRSRRRSLLNKLLGSK